MSRTYKDVPIRLIWESMPDEMKSTRLWLQVGHVPKAVRRKARRVLNRVPSHPRMMRSLDGAYCRNRNCCRVEGSRARARERREWQKEVTSE